MNSVDLPDGVNAHDGTQLDGEQRFFAEFPSEIGTPVSAGSNISGEQLRVRKTGLSQNIVYCCLFLLLPVAILLAMLQLPATVTVGLLLVTVALLVLLARRLGHVDPTNTFVGRHGFAVARYRAGGVEWESVRCDQITQYYCSETIHVVEGGYGGSTFSCRWQRSDGQAEFRVNGAHFLSDDVITGQEDLYRFSRAAEVTWYQYDHERRMAEIERDGTTTFILGDFGTAVIEPGVLTLNLLKKSHRLTRADTDTASVDGGIFRLIEKGASTVTKRGRHTFAISYVESPESFLRFVKDVADIPLASF